MKNITGKLEQVFLPQKALVVYQPVADDEQVYVEAYDMDEAGRPINAHPLSVQETVSLAECLNTASEVQTDYLQCRSLLPGKLLYLNNRRGYAIWHTPAQQANLLFSDSLHVPCGQASVPAMVWKADRDKLTVFALKTNRIPKADTVLYQSPFLNVSTDGQVCMGTVDTNPASADSLEDFMEHWEQAFWNSYFSHLNVAISPVKGNVIQLWKELVGSDRPFPNEVLKKTIWTLNDLTGNFGESIPPFRRKVYHPKGGVKAI